MSIDRTRIINALRYWRAVEHFLPFDLKGALAQFKEKDRLEGNIPDHKLPWYPKRTRADEGKEDFHPRRFTLYLHVFQHREMIRSLEKLVGNLRAHENVIGETCFAQMGIDDDGVPITDSFKLSSLPWAVGRIVQNKKGQLFDESFSSFYEDLKSEVEDYMKVILLRKDERFVRAVDLIALCDIFKEKFGWSPTTELKFAYGARVVRKPTSQGISQEASIRDPEILNSFFVQELFALEREVKAGNYGKAFEQFFGDHPGTPKDLLSLDNHDFLLSLVAPGKLLDGRWLSEPGRNTSLMQQVALAAIKQRPQSNEPLISVNGPPGTGKTTMLKDLLADIIVQRASALATFSRATDGFGKTIQSVADNKDITLRMYSPLITGHEMIVASSNNVAVENISVELPLRSNIATCYFETARYLKPVAQRLLNQKNRTEDSVWGLLSCVMGKKSNRDEFRERFFFKDREDDNKPELLKKRLAEKLFTIHEFVLNYAKEGGISFSSAQQRFLDDKKELSTIRSAIENVAAVWQEHRELVAKGDVQRLRTEITKNQKDNERLALSLRECVCQRENELQRRIALQSELKILKENAPSLLQRIIFFSSAARRYRKTCASLKMHIVVSTQKLIDINQEADALLIRSKSVQGVVTVLHAEKSAIEKTLSDLEHQLLEAQESGICLPPLDGDLENQEVQCNGVWQSEGFSRSQNQLFMSALALHEAWIAEAYRHGLRENLFALAKFLSNKIPFHEDAVKTIWQTLFLCVPLISTTFAALGPMLKELGAESFGWLFIDEAGQSVPQAAVGGLWRAKHAVVVGDPLQIPPVMTVPEAIVNYLGAEVFQSKHYLDFSPQCQSVQRIADRVNPLGGILKPVHDEERWIGIPLRVHRRCDEPMFSISNEIAYGNTMIFGTPRRDDDGQSFADESCWFDLRGEATERHWVRSQGQFVLERIIETARKQQKLPHVYILSPFVTVVAKMRELFHDNRSELTPFLSSNDLSLKKKELDQWLKTRIGTIHTFQGKEEDVVFFVLGADAKNAGAARWAANEPNILNVAVTRARRRLYIVGDCALWGKLPYFEVALRKLKNIQLNNGSA